MTKYEAIEQPSGEATIAQQEPGRNHYEDGDVFERIAAMKRRTAEQEPVAVRLWDSQWVNVVNHDNCYRDWSKEDAINHAVKMTEKYIAGNVASNKLPPAQQEPVAMYEDWYNTNSCGHCGMVGGHTKICRHYTSHQHSAHGLG